jgi:hypothetical protein
VPNPDWKPKAGDGPEEDGGEGVKELAWLENAILGFDWELARLHP